MTKDGLTSMVFLPTYTQQPWTQTYSEIIDVRSPSEFAEDRIPGAINLPVLNDTERAKVGKIYKQVSSFEARKIGAALIAKNISCYLQQHFSSKPKDYHPLIYCWRGGQRSLSMGLVLSQIGWQVTLLEGGYKAYRAYVRQQIDTLPQTFTYRILCGLTGSGKTYILRQMRDRGAQVLDLEALANHRGSLFGDEWQNQPSPQPSQKYFESLLLEQLQTFNPHKPVWVESESLKIGKLYLPQSLWQKMRQAICVEICLPVTARVQFLLQEYQHLVNNLDLLKTKIARLKSYYGWKKLNYWYQLIDNGNLEEFVRDILECHYDPTYKKSLLRDFKKVERFLSIPDLSPHSINNLLDNLLLNNEAKLAS
jgi:tRNA 2-selenouridine synthase